MVEVAYPSSPPDPKRLIYVYLKVIIYREGVVREKCLDSLEPAEGVLAGVGDVKESVLRALLAALLVFTAIFSAADNRAVFGDGKGRKKGHVPVLILVLLVNAAHEHGGGWQDLVDEDEDGLLGGELDALADYVDELTYGQICGY